MTTLTHVYTQAEGLKPAGFDVLCSMTSVIRPEQGFNVVGRLMI